MIRKTKASEARPKRSEEKRKIQECARALWRTPHFSCSISYGSEVLSEDI